MPCTAASPSFHVSTRHHIIMHASTPHRPPTRSTNTLCFSGSAGVKASFLSKLSLHDRSPNASCSNHSRPMGGEEDGRARPLSSRAKLLRSTFWRRHVAVAAAFQPCTFHTVCPEPRRFHDVVVHLSRRLSIACESRTAATPHAPPPSIQLCVMMAKRIEWCQVRHGVRLRIRRSASAGER